LTSLCSVTQVTLWWSVWIANLGCCNLWTFESRGGVVAGSWRHGSCTLQGAHSSLLRFHTLPTLSEGWYQHWMHGNTLVVRDWHWFTK
jgi:hypothetical protein